MFKILKQYAGNWAYIQIYFEPVLLFNFFNLAGIKLR